MANVEYIKLDYHITLKSYKKKFARSPAPVLPTCVYIPVFLLLIERPKVTSTTIHGHARVPESPCVVVVISILIRKIFQC